MIPKPYIAEWQPNAPWKSFAQIEQDLIISRALVAIFSDPFLKENLAFRGGTALHKLYLLPAPRYSEDIDLVQVNPGPIKPIMERLNEAIEFFAEPRQTQLRNHSARIVYRFTSEHEEIPMRLKIEINSREHFNVMGLIDKPFSIENGWFSGSTDIVTYHLNELLGSKLRALYQRRKGRDLFDLFYARIHPEFSPTEVLECFNAYMRHSVSKPPSVAEIIQNLEEKEKNEDFLRDMEGLIRPGVEYDIVEAFAWTKALFPIDDN